MSRFYGGPKDGQSASHVSPRATELCIRMPNTKIWHRYESYGPTRDMLYKGECPGHDYLDHDEPYCPDDMKEAS